MFIRVTIQIVFAFLALTMCGSGAGGHNNSKDAVSENRSPNIILIMADDVSWECFGSYGGQDYQTHHLDALAEKGIRFENCFSTPLCTPSRVKIMTGKYNFRNYTYFGYLDPEEKTFGHLMQQAGYRTAIAGKWQLNGLYHNAEGSEDNTRPHKAGFDEYCLWQVTMGKSVKNGGGERFWSPLLEKNGEVISIEDNHGLYGPDIMSDFVCDFIGENRDQPFFIYYPTVLVHDPFVQTPDNIGDAPRTHEANLAPKDPGEQKNNFVAMVNYMDRIVGKIVKQLEDTGQLENTLILFTADNGTNVRITSRWNDRDIHGGKGSTTDMGTHVPLIAYWKGHTPEGVVLEDLVDFSDFYPTLAEAAGIELGAGDPIDGYSFLPQLLGKMGKPRPWQLCHYQPYWGAFEGRQYVRDAQFKLYRDGRFYHVPEDLYEMNNLEDSGAGVRAEKARKELSALFGILPPAPPVKGGRNAVERPTFPDWQDISDR